MVVPALCVVFLALVNLSRLASYSGLENWLSGLEFMTFATSLGLLLLGICLVIIAGGRRQSLFIPLLSGLVLLECTVAILLHAPLAPPGTGFFAPPSPASIAMMLFLGCAILLMNHPREAIRHFSEYLAGGSAVLALAGLLAVAVGPERTSGFGIFTMTSFYTSLVALLLASSALFLTPQGAVFQLLIDMDLAGRFTRKLVLLILGVLAIIAVIANPAFAPSLLATPSDLVILVALLMVLMLVALFTMGHLFRIETLESSSLESQLSESSNHLQKVLEIAPLGIMTVNTQGVICSANRAAGEIFGYPFGGLVGLHVDRFVPATVRDRHASFRAQYADRPETRAMGTTRELRAVRADGKEINVEIFLAPIVLKKNPMVVLSVSDISERVDLHAALLAARDGLQSEVEARTEQLERSYEALMQRNSELQQFAYAASHDLQTPLRGIGGYAGALKEDYADKLDEKAHRYLDFVVDEVHRLQNLINDLLNYAQIDVAGSGKVVEVDLNAVVDEVVGSLKLAHSEQPFAFTRDQLPGFYGNPALMAQLFHNLIDNAIKYSRDELPRIHLGLGADNRKDLLHLQIEDNGIGIEEEQYERIFEIFRRLHTRNERPGTGIGLALCKRIVERYGGSLGVVSQVGQGSIFYIKMPNQAAS